MVYDIFDFICIVIIGWVYKDIMARLNNTGTVVWLLASISLVMQIE